MATTTTATTGPFYSLSQAQAQQAAAEAASAATAKTNDPSERFLKLLVTQLQNQDPLNPLDNAQVTSQMAQISTVQGIEKLNESMKAMLGRANVGSQIESAGLIGRDVLRASDAVTLTGGATRTTGVQMGASFDATVTGATATLLDAGGKAVRSIALGRLDAGVHGIAWDGLDDAGKPLPDGAYTLKVTASDGVNPVSGTALTPARVVAVTADADGGARLQLDRGASIAASGVKGIL